MNTKDQISQVLFNMNYDHLSPRQRAHFDKVTFPVKVNEKVIGYYLLVEGELLNLVDSR